MKKIIWVLENIKRTSDFYTEADILMLLSSIVNWKRHHGKNTFNELHCDSMTYRLLLKLDAIKLWDKVETKIVDSPSKINKISFWASSKVRVLAAMTEPVTIVDNDFITYSNLTQFDEAGIDVVYSHDEDARMWYYGPKDPFVSRLTGFPDWLIHSPEKWAINVSYLSFNEINIQKRYTHYSLMAMEQFSELNAPFGAHMTYAEQKLLKNLLSYKNIPCKSLHKNLYSCAHKRFWNEEFNTHGIFLDNEAKTKFWHVGFEKAMVRKSEDRRGFFYRLLSKDFDMDKLKLDLRDLLLTKIPQ